MKIYLDDVRPAPKGWILVKTASEMINYLETSNVVEISLDHDLGIEETGYDVLLYIEKKVVLEGYKAPLIHIHTANPVARIKMMQARNNILQYSKYS
jgi:hypothetical protein